MKVNGLRADDLAGTGLVTRQRWALPLWLGVLMAVTVFCWRRLARLAAALGRCWRGTVPAALLLLGYARLGLAGAVTVVGVGFAAATAWQVVAPESFDWLVRQRVRGAWRWHTKYRRRWVPAMEGVGRHCPTGDTSSLKGAVSRG